MLLYVSKKHTMLARALPVHPYDSALAWTSLFVWYAAWHIDRDTPHAVALRAVMFVQALVSLDHWLRYREDLEPVLRGLYAGQRD